MGIFGKLLSTPIRILNVPARASEKFVDPDSSRDDDENILSKPLESLAKALDEVDKQLEPLTDRELRSSSG